MERSGREGDLSVLSAVQEVSHTYEIPVIAIANLNDLFEYISAVQVDAQQAGYKDAIAAYRQRYGVE
jgi:orotate phosphoribosyltransferase